MSTPLAAPAAAAALAPAPAPGEARLDRRFWRQALATIAARAGALPLAVLGSMVVARGLGPAGRGTFGVMMTVGAIGVQLANLGLPSATVYALGRDPGRLRQLLGLALLVSLGLGGALVLVLGALASFGLGAATLTPLQAWAAAAWIPVGLLLLLAQNALLGLRAVRPYNLLQLALDAAGMLALVACLWAGWRSPARFYGASLGVTALAALVAVALVLRRAGAAPAWPGAELVRSSLRYGARAYLSTLFAYLLINFDLLMVASLSGARDAGFYAIAGRLAELIFLAPAAVGAILFTTISSLREGRWAFTRRVTLALALALPPLLLLAALLARPAVTLLYGDAFAPAVGPFLWLLPGVYLLSVNIPLMNYFAGTGMPPITVAGPAAGLVLNVALNLWWIPRYGTAGAAAASSVAYGLMLATSLAYLRLRRVRA